MKQKFVDYYMRIAEETSLLSYAKRLKVGAVMVKGEQIIATGYNGTPRGANNVAEVQVYAPTTLFSKDEFNHYCDDTQQWYKLVTKPNVIHAESNCIMKVARSTESSLGSTMFCTHAPCMECAKLIYQAGIGSLYYRDSYRSNDGLLLLDDMGVTVTKY